MTKKFGELLRTLREERGILLKELAKNMGWSVVYLSDIERGRRNPPARDYVEKMANFLKVKVANLLDAADRDRGFVELNLNGEISKTKAALTLARSWNNLNDEDWEEIVSLINRRHGGEENADG